MSLYGDCIVNKGSDNNSNEKEEAIFDLLKIENNGFHHLFDQVDVISVQGYDEHRRVIYWNEGSEKLYGFSKEEAIGKKLEDLIIPKVMREAVVQAHSQWLNAGEKIPSSELILCRADGVDIHVYSSHVMYTNSHDQQQMYCIDIDLSTLKQVEEKANQKEMLLKTVFEAIPDLFFLLDEKAIILDYHAANENDLYVSPDVFMGASIAEILPSEVYSTLKESIAKVRKQGGLVSFEYALPLNNEYRHFDARLNRLPDTEQYIVIIRDVTENKKIEDRIRHQALYDTLTHLPNRFLALDRLKQLIHEAKRDNDKIAVLFLDLDDFKNINDSLGHDIGDKLLVESADRLLNVVREEDTVGRLGGDEFIILLQGIKNPEDVLATIKHLLKRFQEPFNIEGKELILTVSIGISIYPNNGLNHSELLRNADTAMYQAKNLGRNTYSFFTEAMNVDLTRRFALEGQIRGALNRHEFEVYYQPQIDANSGRIIGAEALLRWHNEKLGDVSPAEFIPIAEQTGLIIPIGQFVLKEALIVLKKWQTTFDNRLRMAVNLSPRQFRDPELIQFVKSALIEADISAESLELEITEGVLMIGHSYIYDALSDLSALGIQLSMDDFGTGYSSLSYLREYNFDVIKVDQSFIRDIAEDSADKDLVNAAIAMAHSLGLKVVAEGVENEEQLFILEELNCDYIQGFYFSKPLPEKELFLFSTSYIP